MIDSMQRLGEYAAPLNLSILIENHGLFSSDGKWVAEVIKQSGRTNCGTLPDFGNWCLSAKWGTTQIDCTEVYDRYQGVADLLPFAKGVSAKSYAFDTEGNETRMDYPRLLKLVKEAGFEGYVGIEFEGFDMPEPEGIKATKKLLERSWQALG
jgi:sugar phosphate isomerase/epimerase